MIKFGHERPGCIHGFARFRSANAGRTVQEHAGGWRCHPARPASRARAFAHAVPGAAVSRKA